MRDSESAAPSQSASLGRLVAFWFLVGASLAGLWLGVHDALAVRLPVSSPTAAFAFSVVAAAALWTAGFRPSVRESAVYFLTHLAAHLLLVIAIAGPTPNPWTATGLRVASVLCAATLGFASVGRQARQRLREAGRRLLRQESPCDG
ncbi:hypothetical protein [Halobacterium sp. CBA1126]|uniref:hypothetical protein n=1 Tax=Halobacterium sp. CBA1126 TaxID=2668074 RepID=UPI0012FCA0BD|nr:hypothetical protein [Halobacterium sp. CBA1126]MUV59561.1 hypothetical protein [Halobacterium sp. CBA1126]